MEGKRGAAVHENRRPRRDCRTGGHQGPHVSGPLVAQRSTKWRLWVGRLPVDLPYDFRPPVDDGQYRVRLLGREHRHPAGDAHLCKALHPVEILAEAEQGDFDGGWIASGLPCHLAEFRQDIGDIAAPRHRNPTVAIADRAPRALREGAADMDRRVRLLYRFGPGDHRIEMHELSMVFGLGFRPDFLHRLDGFAHPLEAIE